MTLDEIFALKGPEAFEGAFGEWSHDRLDRLGYAHLTPGERRVIRVNAFIMEVNGNGFDGFLFNSAGGLGARGLRGLARDWGQADGQAT